MNILICDDINEDTLKLETVIGASGFEANIVKFNHGSDVLSYIQSGAKVDLCFLDILMPDMNGTALALQMRKENYKGKIIFLTSSNDYAVESYKANAYSYLLKPPNVKSITSILHKVEEMQKSADTAGIPIVTRNMSRFLFFYEISYVEAIQHKVYFRLLDRSELEANITLRELLKKFQYDGRFAQCHRSYIINMNAVSYVQDRNVILRCGKKIPISKSYLDFSKQYLNWVFGRELE